MVDPDSSDPSSEPDRQQPQLPAWFAKALDNLQIEREIEQAVEDVDPLPNEEEEEEEDDDSDVVLEPTRDVSRELREAIDTPLPGIRKDASRRDDSRR
jgi:hypothetical protein